MWTWAVPFTELLIQAKKESLLSAFWTALHPLALGHEFDTFIRIWDICFFRFLFDLYDFFTSILGEEDT